MTNSVNLEDLDQWMGRTEAVSDCIAATPVRALRATLDLPTEPVDGTALPVPWHWLYFSSPARAADVDIDGHPKRGGFLPPVPLPRRMWAGGRLEIRRALTVGENAARKSTIKTIAVKQGRSGTLVFVTVLHEISDQRGLAIVEEQDLVYRDVAAAASVTPVRPEPFGETGTHSRLVVPDPVLLFRYSALTFNGHRIHYDRDYATSVEGYAGLVVHGPLIATLLLALLERERPHVHVRHFSFKAISPLIDIYPFSLHMRADRGGQVKLWALNQEGALAMSAEAVISE
jgi:3-methylfumaryl-CoA hydratase